MIEIAGIGANVCDTLIKVPCYPKEDTKMHASSSVRSGGGPCATGLVAAAKLGAKCAYIGNTTDDGAAMFLKADFEKYNVSTEYMNTLKGYNSFSSVIWLAEDTASRTCVFDKGNVPPAEISDKQADAVRNAEILMVDGNELDAAVKAAQIAKESGTLVLYDAGGLYDGIERLLPYADILIPSEEFALGITKADNAEEAAKILFEKYQPEVTVVTQGKIGGVLYDGKEMQKYPAFLVDAVDSNGSGDVFHGAFAFCLTRGFDYMNCCVFSSAVSALKCTGIGARESVPSYEETLSFIEKRGYRLNLPRP